jgi:hypothetical protein
LSKPNSKNVHRLTSANRPRALGRVRRVGRFMRDVWVGDERGLRRTIHAQQAEETIAIID